MELPLTAYPERLSLKRRAPDASFSFCTWKFSVPTDLVDGTRASSGKFLKDHSKSSFNCFNSERTGQ